MAEQMTVLISDVLLRTFLYIYMCVCVSVCVYTYINTHTYLVFNSLLAVHFQVYISIFPPMYDKSVSSRNTKLISFRHINQHKLTWFYQNELTTQAQTTYLIFEEKERILHRSSSQLSCKPFTRISKSLRKSTVRPTPLLRHWRTLARDSRSMNVHVSFKTIYRIYWFGRWCWNTEAGLPVHAHIPYHTNVT